MDKLKERADTFWRILARVACVFMGAVIILIVVNVVLRRAFNAPIFGSTELICYGVLITSSFALSQNEWVDGNIRMSLIVELLPTDKAKNILWFIVNLACTVGLVISSYLLFHEVGVKYLHGDKSLSLSLPVWFFYLILSIGFLLLTVTFIVKEILTIDCIRKGLPPYNLKEYAKSRTDEDMLE